MRRAPKSVVAAASLLSWLFLAAWIIQRRADIPPRLGLRCGIDSAPSMLVDSFIAIVTILLVTGFVVVRDARACLRVPAAHNPAASVCFMGLLLWFAWHIVYCNTYSPGPSVFQWLVPLVGFPMLGLLVDLYYSRRNDKQ